MIFLQRSIQQDLSSTVHTASLVSLLTLLLSLFRLWVPLGRRQRVDLWGRRCEPLESSNLSFPACPHWDMQRQEINIIIKGLEITNGVQSSCCGAFCNNTVQFHIWPLVVVPLTKGKVLCPLQEQSSRPVILILLLIVIYFWQWNQRCLLRELHHCSSPTWWNL